MFVFIPSVLFLNSGAVTQHNSRDIRRRSTAENGASKAGLKQAGQIPAMIDMSVRQNDRIDFLRSAPKTFILWTDFFPASLKQTAVQQQPDRVRLDKMLTASDFTGGTEECDFHEAAALIKLGGPLDFGSGKLLFFTTR